MCCQKIHNSGHFFKFYYIYIVQLGINGKFSSALYKNKQLYYWSKGYKITSLKEWLASVALKP